MLLVHILYLKVGDLSEGASALDRRVRLLRVYVDFNGGATAHDNGGASDQVHGRLDVIAVEVVPGDDELRALAVGLLVDQIEKMRGHLTRVCDHFVRHRQVHFRLDRTFAKQPSPRALQDDV